MSANHQQLCPSAMLQSTPSLRKYRPSSLGQEEVEVVGPGDMAPWRDQWLTT